MKHRSVGIFVVLLAALAAAPQASEQLLSMKDSLGERVRAGIWCAILDLHEQESANEIARRQSQQARISNPETARIEAPSARKAIKGVDDKDADARRVSQGASRPAVLASPSSQLQIVVAASDRGKLPVSRELAMIIPPEQGVHPASPVAEIRETRVLRWNATEHEVKADELQKDAAFIAARREVRLRMSGGDVRRQLDSVLHRVGGFRVAGGETQFRIVKIKRPDKLGGTARSGRTSCPKKQDALPIIVTLKLPVPPAHASE
ncbi:MAG: hypothetical protein LC754_14210 [Acidobacteria bacterium]|nr:hypothetical protein [Acidobacteriota bacterium]